MFLGNTARCLIRLRMRPSPLSCSRRECWDCRGEPCVAMRRGTVPRLTATLVADVWSSTRLSLSLSDDLYAAKVRGWKVEFHCPTSTCPPWKSLPCPLPRFPSLQSRVFVPLRLCSQQNERRSALNTARPYRTCAYRSGWGLSRRSCRPRKEPASGLSSFPKPGRCRTR